MDIDDKGAASKDSKDSKDSKEAEKDAKEPEEKVKEKEPEFELLQNPTRVIKPQLKVISQPKNSRYQPLKDVACGGIIMLKDSQSDQP